MPATKVLRKLWAVSREHNISSDNLHAFVFAEFALQSISALTDREAYYIIDKIQGKSCNKPHPVGMITHPQRNYINRLVDDLGWGDNPKRLMGFISKYAKVESIDWLTQNQASKVIEGLKRLISKAV